MEIQKLENYRSLADPYQFEPVALETTEVLSNSTLLFLYELGRRVSAQTRNDREA